MSVIDRRSVSEQVATSIRDRILSLSLMPGSRLIVEELAGLLGVSNTPVREGLRELVTQELVRYDGGSYWVISFSEKDIQDLYAIRRALEGLAVSRATPIISREALQELRSNLEAGLSYTSDDQEEDRLIAMDFEFHESIAKNSGSKILADLLESTRMQTMLLRRWLFVANKPESWELASIREHLTIVERMEQGDAAGAARAMVDHLERAGKRNLESFRKKE